MLINAVLKEKEAGAYSVVGKRLPLIDAGEKVSGRAQYTGDMELPGMLYAKILRSPYAHARVMRVDTSAADATAFNPPSKPVIPTSVQLHVSIRSSTAKPTSR